MNIEAVAPPLPAIACHSKKVGDHWDGTALNMLFSVTYYLDLPSVIPFYYWCNVLSSAIVIVL